MKLLRFKYKDIIKPGILDNNGNIRDISSYVDDWTGDTINDQTLDKINNHNINDLPIINSDVLISPSIGRVGKFIGVGLNYSDHAAEAGIELPKEPILFMKATSSICGPNEDIIIPKNSTKLDWEVELGIIIGKEARYIDEKESQQYIAGYCVVNDLSERGFQFEGTGQWTKGKSFNTFGPIGPYLVTKDEIPNPQNLKMWLYVNNQLMQKGSTASMIFGVNFLVSYISQFMSLQAGDIITTGTPPGVGMGKKPPVYLKSRDNIRLGIDGLGEQNQNAISY